ncbi:hypothetical protein PoB_003480300 [Plakobranchus ocellatus]|uniref:Uncharacterized protein n=1 Tax=Plakobranchus ocellatus TaxID=259542 RepID=A0AAV4ANB1_9GAST|nr:hypothetical protein PoB_003480300 [Plakobranchus ocellatus]
MGYLTTPNHNSGTNNGETPESRPLIMNSSSVAMSQRMSSRRILAQMVVLLLVILFTTASGEEYRIPTSNSEDSSVDTRETPLQPGM